MPLWPYVFPALTHEEKQLRRQSLDLYACIAHYSAVTPVVLLLAYRLIRRVTKPRYTPLSSSTSPWTKFTWWMGDPIILAGRQWGLRDQWVLGTAWTAWLLFLCVCGTGTDYFHLTKRFGIVAVSQLPMQYILSIKGPNPVAFALGTSHERINRYHRTLGRIVYGFLVTHFILYLTYFVIAGILLSRTFAPVVLCGVIASLGMHALAFTSTTTLRDYSYRLFYVTHLVVGLFMPILIFVHAASARFYLVETVALFLLNRVMRVLATTKTSATLQRIHGSTLVKITAPVALQKLSPFRAAPGAHVYLSVPAQGRKPDAGNVFDFIYSPFTVAAVHDGSVTLVARARGGPLSRYLAGHAATSATLPLALEGPYGSMTNRFEDLLSFGADRILLFAGGVGATFILPVYRALQDELTSKDNRTTKLQLVWAVRAESDTAWAVAESTESKSVLDDESIRLFVTAADGGAISNVDDDGAMQMTQPTSPTTVRPPVAKLVDDAFRKGRDDAIAVLVCGPNSMAADIRRSIRPWALKERAVWWHNETVGW